MAARPAGSVVRRAQRLALAILAVALAPVVVEAEGMLVLSGRYTGNGADDRAIYVGFRPDIVIVDMDDTVTVAPAAAVIRTSTMVGDVSKDMDGPNPPAADRIQSLTTTGFVVGTYATVNEAGRTYHWVAFRAAAGELKVGSYAGDGVTDARSIPGVGFQPEYVIVMSGGSEQVVQRSSAMLGDLTHQFDSTGFANGIEALEADGFRVGLDPRVNAGSTTYYYAAWNAVPGRVAVGVYTGNGATSRDITGVGVYPEWVHVTRSGSSFRSTHKPASTGVGTDRSLLFESRLGEPDNIQALLPDGFQVGGHSRVNSNTAPNDYYWAAFGPHTPQTNYRSIGNTAVLYGTNGTAGVGTRVSVTNGLATVTGLSGTTWRASNRGRGDVITIPCDNPPTCTSPTAGVHYTVLAVTSDSSLVLSPDYQGADNASASYVIRRQLSTLSGWEDCIDGGGTACGVLPPVPSADLVNDDRREVGIAFDDATPSFLLTGSVQIQGSTTDASHTIRLTADPPNRHNGVAGAGVVIDANLGANEIDIRDPYVTLEWLELVRANLHNTAAIQVWATPGPPADVAHHVVLQNLLIHDFGNKAADGTSTTGIDIAGTSVLPGVSITIRNTMIWDGDTYAIEGDAQTFDSMLIENVSIDGMKGAGIHASSTVMTIRNTIVTGSPLGNDFDNTGTLLGSNNTSSDGTAALYFSNALSASAATTFVSASDLHLRAGANSIDSGLDLMPSFGLDIDGQPRPVGLAWDRGADERGATTAVKLQSLSAIPGDASVLLAWQTASELDNLGFHVYRALFPDGPWTRLTSSLVPGLGSSALGQAYAFRDLGLQNGTRYYYRLEDVDAASQATSHGPVSAVPQAGAVAGDETSSGSGGGKKKDASASGCPEWVLVAYGSASGSETSALRCTRHGDPEATALSVSSRDARSATLELTTGGFYALHEPSGSVRVFVPGFDFPSDPQAAALPFRRALVDAVVGRRVQLGGVRAMDRVGFPGLVPSSFGKAEMQVFGDGTVRAGRRAVREVAPRWPSPDLARLLPSVFQGETKSAVVEISPLRFDARRQQLVLARRVRVRLLFTGRETGESGRASRGRRAPGSGQPAVTGEVLARLYSTSLGLHAVSFEQLFPGRRRSLRASQLRLERQGRTARFHIEPASDSFGPGSRLFFYAETRAVSTDFSSETAWELLNARDGVQMPLVSGAPLGNPVLSPSAGQASFETNRIYQPGLLDAADPWLWDGFASGATRTMSFSLSGVDSASPQTAEIEVFLQGASESGHAVDHHVSISLAGVLVGDAQFAGKRPYRMRLSVPVSLLREGDNELSLSNVPDTGVTSYVFLDRFTISFPQKASLAGGVFEGSWTAGGTATLAGTTAPAVLLDVTGAGAAGVTGGVLWLTAYETTGGSLRFRAEAGHRYLAVSEPALLTPRVAAPAVPSLRSTRNQADYLLIAPRAFLGTAEPLLQRRQDQGLATHAVAFEEIADEFGHGQPSAEAVKNFLAFAFHSWSGPSPRYVLLLGDSSYDPRQFMSTSRPSPLPALWAKTSYLWTVSDPQLAAVNGEDTLPDMAIGRLPATTLEEAEAMVEKLVAWEASGQGLSGSATLVADNPDLGGDFEANARDIAESFLAARSELLQLRELGVETRPRILAALDSGLSYLSYVGHGGAAVWASENVWNSWDAASLRAQSQQPLLLTLNCLNGYFVAPAYDSLAESLLKAEGRGAIAAFSPSGLSLDGAAHEYHRALMAELVGGRHERLGDALLAAQKAYAQAGLMPELMSIYHLLGDPAMPIGP